MGVREPKLAGYRKMQVCRWLAERKYTQTQIAEMLDCTPGAVANFAKRNADIINEIRENLEDEFAGMWIAQKRNRVAEYQAQADRLRLLIEQYDEPDAALIRAHQAALKAVAEEMGQLPSRLTVVQTPKEFVYKVDAGEDVDVV